MEHPIDRPQKFYKSDKEKSILVTAGFEQLPDDLWEKDGVVFGRQAALQNALREVDEGGEGVA